MMQLQVKDDNRIKMNKQHIIIKYKGKANWRVERRYTAASAKFIAQKVS